MSTVNAKILRHPALTEFCAEQNAETIRQQQEIIGNVATNLIALFSAADDVMVWVNVTRYRCDGCATEWSIETGPCARCGRERRVVQRRRQIALSDLGVNEIPPQELGNLLAAYALGEKKIEVRCGLCDERNSGCTCGGAR